MTLVSSLVMLKPAHSSCCILMLPWYALSPLFSSVNLTFLFSSSYFSSSFYYHFQLPLFSPRDSTPFFDFDTCLSTFPSLFRWVCVCVYIHMYCMCLCLHGLNRSISLPFISVAVLLTISHTLSGLPLRNQSCQHTHCFYMNVVCWPSVGRYLCQWFGWGVLLSPYSKAGLRKIVSCGGLRPRPFSSPPLSLGSCQAKVFPLSDWLQRWAASWRGCVSL